MAHRDGRTIALLSGVASFSREGSFNGQRLLARHCKNGTNAGDRRQACRQRSFNKLVWRYEQRVLAVAQRITKIREDAEDVMQESFQKAFLRLHEFEERARFFTWLTRIAINESFMSIRRRHVGVEGKTIRPKDGLHVIAERVADRTPSPEVNCWRREHAEILHKAITRLNTTARATILLRALEEHSIQETARIMRTTITAVRARSFHGQRKLRALLKPALLSDMSSCRMETAERS